MMHRLMMRAFQDPLLSSSTEVIVIVRIVSLFSLLCQLPANAQSSRHRRQTGDGSACIEIEKGEQFIFFICYKTLASIIYFVTAFQETSPLYTLCSRDFANFDRVVTF
jgi:hypothetical protein